MFSFQRRSLKFVFLGCFSWEVVALGMRWRVGENFGHGQNFMTNLKTDKCEPFIIWQLKIFSFHFVRKLRCQKVLQTTNTFKARKRTHVFSNCCYSVVFGAILRHFQTNIIVLDTKHTKKVFLNFSRTILGNFDSKKTSIDH